MLKKINKRGVLGMDTVKVVMVALLILAVLAIVTFLVIVNLRDAFEDAESKQSVTVVNDSAASVDETPPVYLSTSKLYRNPTCTVTCTNATDGVAIPAGNITTTNYADGCAVAFYGPTGTLFNGTNWKCSYTMTVNMAGANDLVQNLTSGTGNFFKQIPTFFTLLAVVVLILIIAIVIIAVTRFQSGEGGMMGGMSSGGSSFASDEL